MHQSYMPIIPNLIEKLVLCIDNIDQRAILHSRRAQVRELRKCLRLCLAHSLKKIDRIARLLSGKHLRKVRVRNLANSSTTTLGTITPTLPPPTITPNASRKLLYL